MSQQINKLQVRQGTQWAGLTTSNYLGTLFMEQPQVASSIVSRLFAERGMANMSSILTMIEAEQEMDTDGDYVWYLQGNSDKSIPVVSYTAASTTMPGLNHSIVKIEFGEKYFSKTDVLSADDRRFRVRVMTEPYSNGINWIYEVQLMTGDPTLFIPPSLLTSTSSFSKQYSAAENTLSKQGGNTSYSSPFEMRNGFTHLRKEDTIAANMLNRPLSIGVPSSKGNSVIKVWTQYAEMEFMRQWEQEKGRQILYGESNKTANGTYAMKGDSGFEIKEGSGIRDQISPAYRFNYNTFSIKWLEDILIQLSVNILQEDQRHFVALTGEYGMRQFNTSLEDYVAKFNVRDEKRIFGSGQTLGFGGQYTEFRGSNGLRFTLVKLADYDDQVHNRILHPAGGPTESYRYTILHMGTTKGKKNIRRIYPKGEREKMWHVPGSTTPYGPNTSFKTSAASSVDGYSVYAAAKQSVIVENPMACAELVFA